MIQINCPWCGTRDEEEFTCGGQSHIERPMQPENISDEQWASYLFDRVNPKGIHLERWRHTFGCRQWFNLARDTVTHEILAIYRMGEPAPEILRGHPQLGNGGVVEGATDNATATINAEEEKA